MRAGLTWLLSRGALLVAAVAVLAVGAGAAWYLLQATVLTIAVAPRDGTEPELIKAYADALDAAGEGVRFKILSFDDVRESAAALQDGRADLAVVRPDVLLPTNGLTLAILRDQAMIIASPDHAPIKSFPKLAGKRLGIAAHRDADFDLLKNLLGYYGLVPDWSSPAQGRATGASTSSGSIRRMSPPPSGSGASTSSSASSRPPPRRRSPSSARFAPSPARGGWNSSPSRMTGP